MSSSYLHRVFEFFGINKEQEVKHMPVQLKYYQIKPSEVDWAVRKILANRAKYVAMFGDDWVDGAVLHFIVMRLNYAKLHMLKPRALTEYTEHYFFDAAMAVKDSLVKRWNRQQA